MDNYFSDVDNCRKDLILAREFFGNKHTTIDQYDQLEKTLGIMYTHCPDSIHTTVYATLIEAETRRVYFEKYIW